MIFNAERRQPVISLPLYSAVRTGGGIWVGLRSRAKRPDGGGLLRCGARTFVRRAGTRARTNRVYGRLYPLLTIGRGFDTPYRDACPIGKSLTYRSPSSLQWNFSWVSRKLLLVTCV